MASLVPIVTSLEDIYTPDAVQSQVKRWNSLLARFKTLYGHSADFVARSPGRVNIIGEHIDYSLYSVLPMGITADVIIAASTSHASAEDGTCRVQIANVLDRFPAHEFTVGQDGKLAIDATVHEWTNYFKAGMLGALELLRKKAGSGFVPKSMRLLMDGAVPPGGGLSSSSAFVCTSALAVMIANGKEEAIGKTELTEVAIVSERAVGTNGGGMDQAASIFSERGSALFVSFTPSVTTKPVFFPKTSPELTFLIAQSFVQADKVVTSQIHYNLRVVECSLAAAYLHAKLNPPGTQLPADAAPLGISLHGFQATYFADKPGKTAAEQLEALADIARQTLIKEEGYTRAEISAVIGLADDDLERRFMSRFPVRAKRFKLRQRALHVFTEALRVLRFMDLLSQDPGASTSTGAGHVEPEADASSCGARLGALLNESQASCRDGFECSCPELDALCAAARAAGSYGSRLTGAGWGGCSVHLVPADRVADVRAAWEREYYGKRADLTPEQREAAVVVSRPGGGSAVFRVRGDRVEA